MSTREVSENTFFSPAFSPKREALTIGVKMRLPTFQSTSTNTFFATKSAESSRFMQLNQESIEPFSFHHLQKAFSEGDLKLVLLILDKKEFTPSEYRIIQENLINFLNVERGPQEIAFAIKAQLIISDIVEGIFLLPLEKHLKNGPIPLDLQTYFFLHFIKEKVPAIKEGFEKGLFSFPEGVEESIRKECIPKVEERLYFQDQPARVFISHLTKILDHEDRHLYLPLKGPIEPEALKLLLTMDLLNTSPWLAPQKNESATKGSRKLLDSMLFIRLAQRVNPQLLDSLLEQTEMDVVYFKRALKFFKPTSKTLDIAFKKRRFDLCKLLLNKEFGLPPSFFSSNPPLDFISYLKDQKYSYFPHQESDREAMLCTANPEVLEFMDFPSLNSRLDPNNPHLLFDPSYSRGDLQSWIDLHPTDRNVLLSYISTYPLDGINTLSLNDLIEIFRETNLLHYAAQKCSPIDFINHAKQSPFPLSENRAFQLFIQKHPLVDYQEQIYELGMRGSYRDLFKGMVPLLRLSLDCPKLFQQYVQQDPSLLTEPLKLSFKDLMDHFSLDDLVLLKQMGFDLDLTVKDRNQNTLLHKISKVNDPNVLMTDAAKNLFAPILSSGNTSNKTPIQTTEPMLWPLFLMWGATLDNDTLLERSTCYTYSLLTDRDFRHHDIKSKHLKNAGLNPSIFRYVKKNVLEEVTNQGHLVAYLNENPRALETSTTQQLEKIIDQCVKKGDFHTLETLVLFYLPISILQSQFWFFLNRDQEQVVRMVLNRPDFQLQDSFSLLQLAKICSLSSNTTAGTRLDEMIEGMFQELINYGVLKSQIEGKERLFDRIETIPYSQIVNQTNPILALFRLNPLYYQVSVKEMKIPPKEDSSNYKKILTLFDTHFPTLIYEVFDDDGITKLPREELRTRLEQLLDFIEKEKPYTGVPVEKEDKATFYRELRDALSYIVDDLEVREKDETLPRKDYLQFMESTLLDLCIGGPNLINGTGHCGKRWKHDTSFHYSRNKGEEAIFDFASMIYAQLKNLRLSHFQHLQKRYAGSNYEQIHVGDKLQFFIGKERGISSTGTAFDDHLGGIFTREQALVEFDKLHNLESIFDHIHYLLNSSHIPHEKRNLALEALKDLADKLPDPPFIQEAKRALHLVGEEIDEAFETKPFETSNRYLTFNRLFNAIPLEAFVEMMTLETQNPIDLVESLFSKSTAKTTRAQFSENPSLRSQIMDEEALLLDLGKLLHKDANSLKSTKATEWHKILKKEYERSLLKSILQNRSIHLSEITLNTILEKRDSINTQELFKEALNLEKRYHFLKSLYEGETSNLKEIAPLLILFNLNIFIF